LNPAGDGGFEPLDLGGFSSAQGGFESPARDQGESAGSQGLENPGFQIESESSGQSDQPSALPW
jgi:hypothetical protein